MSRWTTSSAASTPRSPRGRRRRGRVRRGRRPFRRKGGVLEGDAWLDRAEQPLGTGDITVRKQDGGTKRIGGTIALNIHILSCPSYFARDLFDRLFD